MCGGGRFTVLNVFIKREEMSQIGDIMEEKDFLSYLQFSYDIICNSDVTELL